MHMLAKSVRKKNLMVHARHVGQGGSVMVHVSQVGQSVSLIVPFCKVGEALDGLCFP